MAVLLACLALTWPFAEVGVNDDWCYSLIAWDVARTGHLAFHGWASPILGWQAFWGGYAARLFGTSFTVLRLSLLPVSLGTALLYHAVLRKFGLNRAHAIFGALTFVLSPIFIPMADTFMTDITSMFVILVCLYLCQLALEAHSDFRAMLWLSAAALTNIGLGTVRQIAWLGILVIVPSCGWMLRRRRGFLPLTITFLVIGLLCIILVLHWFGGQPYTAPEKVLPGEHGLGLLSNLFRSAWRSSLALLLLCLPVMSTGLPWMFAQGRSWIKWAQMLGGLAVTAALAVNRTAAMKYLPPWTGNILSRTGVVQGERLMAISPIPTPALLAVMFFFMISVAAFISALFLSHARKILQTSEMPFRRERNYLLLPFLAAYCVMLVPRAMTTGVFDRYLLEPIAVALVYFLYWHQKRIGTRLPWCAYPTLALCTLFAVGTTHDLFAMQRARVRLLNEVQQADVPRTSIGGDFEFDAVTEVEARGYVNDPRIENPKSAFVPQPALTGTDPCVYWFTPYSPSIHSRFTIMTRPAAPCTGPSPFAPESYIGWLPIRRHQLYMGTVLR